MTKKKTSPVRRIYLNEVDLTRLEEASELLTKATKGKKLFSAEAVAHREIESTLTQGRWFNRSLGHQPPLCMNPGTNEIEVVFWIAEDEIKTGSAINRRNISATGLHWLKSPHELSNHYLRMSKIFANATYLGKREMIGLPAGIRKYRKPAGLGYTGTFMSLKAARQRKVKEISTAVKKAEKLLEELNSDQESSKDNSATKVVVATQ